MDMTDLTPLLALARTAALRAGEAVMTVYRDGFEVRRKSDASPVTEADGLAEQAILALLEGHESAIPVITEERAEIEGLPVEAPPRFWLVDPLDGTKEFIKRNGEFTVNVALVEHGRPILGVVHIPAQDLTYAAAGPGTATRQRGADGTPEPIAARRPPPEGITVAYSRSHADQGKLDAFLADYVVREHKVAGSALKFCVVAEGVADLYPRLGPTMEWDTAAGQAVLEAAGGSVTTLDGAPFRYGKPGFRNTGFVARGLPKA
jgi:3'(2'), 5'-bisphosphate nucleotidase